MVNTNTDEIPCRRIVCLRQLFLEKQGWLGLADLLRRIDDDHIFSGPLPAIDDELESFVDSIMALLGESM